MNKIQIVEAKWIKECERLSEIIDQYKKGELNIKKHPEYVKMKKELELTNQAYQEIAQERDNLIQRIAENWKMFEEEIKLAKESKGDNR